MKSDGYDTESVSISRMLFLNTDRQRWQRKYSVWLLREASSMRTCRFGFCDQELEVRHEQSQRGYCTRKKPARGKSGSTPAPGCVEQRRACCRRTTETFACGGRIAGWAADSRCRCRFPRKSAQLACTGASTLCSRGRGAWHEFVQACRGTEASRFGFFKQVYEFVGLHLFRLWEEIFVSIFCGFNNTKHTIILISVAILFGFKNSFANSFV